MAAVSDVHEGTVIDRLVAYAGETVPERPELAEWMRLYFAHVDESDLAAREVHDLFGMAADHLQLAASWTLGESALRITNPRIEVDGWESEHTIVQVVTADMPFLVDTVSMELSRQGIGIHFVTHPVVHRDGEASFVHVDDAGSDPRLVSVIGVEIDRHADDDSREALKQDLLRVLDDVRSAVRDWREMRDRMREIGAGLDPANLPVAPTEIDEAKELLNWLADDHFIFLGARDYLLEADNEGTEVLRIAPGSGLGILASNVHLGRPRPIADFGPAARARVHEKRLLNLTKASSRSTVHRASFLDYVGIKTFDEAGEVSGERRFLGLFTSEVYTYSLERIPRARSTADEVTRRAGFPAGGHDEKRLRTILERYPRDDLLQMDADELFDIAIGIAGLQERRRVRLFARREIFGRFVTVLVFLPRDRYNTSIRTGIQDLLRDAYGGSIDEWDAQLSESVLARLRFVMQVEDDGSEVDTAELEAQVETLIHIWDDGLAESMVHEFAHDDALQRSRVYATAFGPDYQRAFNPRSACADIEQIEELGEHGALKLNAYREPGNVPSAFKLKLYRRGARVALTTVMPSLTNLGVTVVDERPYEVKPLGQESVWIYDFSLEHHTTQLDFATAAARVEEAFAAVWDGHAEDDGLNRLVLGAGMRVGDVAVLRAYARYLRQVGLAYSRVFVESTLEQHPTVARLLVDLFTARFDPASDQDSAGISVRLEDAIGSIESLDQDRVLRRFYNLIQGTVRTTWAQRDDESLPRPYIAFKFDPRALDEIPDPRPRHEIFVYSPRFEGVHLRGGPVARGGLRWSDRTEDFRTEVLGLVKAQMVKNAVIVPGGAKGGFVLKQRPSDPAHIRDEVVACYRLFISALLDLTDNLIDGEVVPPADAIRYDGDDTYLVVAADKGTATFSDIANELAVARGFWLGDAFASGGSNGYDHKAMGITARGAWESVKRHFRELGRDVDTEEFTVFGIGDMSGDVFGNGMLQSPFTRVVAAFDHRHVFIDPDPDPAASFAERQRLFDLPRSSWADYDPSLISSGGGVFDRSAKSLNLSPEARAALGTELEKVTPDELISCVLKAPVDLFWNGGIGTYVKSADETHADVGDKTNDRLRVDARELRCAVIGEGGNLGVTQAGRIEFARRGGRVFTDAIDNAAGVNCSDHEVNIKILLNSVVQNGDMTDKQRNQLLEEMTEEVALLVLASNYRQALALSAARADAVSMIDVHARYIEQLEQQGLIDRRLEALPDVDDFAERRLAGTGLATPELAVLNAYSKNILKAELLESPVPEDPALADLLIGYFPSDLRDRFENQIATHQLRREIIANRMANLVVDRAGISMIYRLGLETSAPPTEIAAAHFAAWNIFDLESVVNAVNSLDGVMAVEKQLAAHLKCRQLAERATRLLIRNRPNPFSALDAIDALASPVAETLDGLGEHLLGTDRDAFENEVTELLTAGADVDLARRIASLATSVAALDIVDVARDAEVPVSAVAATHFALADRLELTWLRDCILALPRDTQWTTLARLTLRTDLYTDHRHLTSLVIAANANANEPTESVDQWMRQHQSAVNRFRQTLLDLRSTTSDITVLLVAARELRNLIGRTSAPVGSRP